MVSVDRGAASRGRACRSAARRCGNGSGLLVALVVLFGGYWAISRGRRRRVLPSAVPRRFLARMTAPIFLILICIVALAVVDELNITGIPFKVVDAALFRHRLSRRRLARLSPVCGGGRMDHFIAAHQPGKPRCEPHPAGGAHHRHRRRHHHRLSRRDRCGPARLRSDRRSRRRRPRARPCRAADAGKPDRRPDPLCRPAGPGRRFLPVRRQARHGRGDRPPLDPHQGARPHGDHRPQRRVLQHGADQLHPARPDPSAHHHRPPLRDDPRADATGSRPDPRPARWRIRT